jgi:demethoxyubiquinone hydroxylase (CLK1/Coq7/Cat5 family)
MTNDESRLRLADYLSHMLEAARLAREYVENTVKADFLNDRRTQQAVVLNLAVVLRHLEAQISTLQSIDSAAVSAIRSIIDDERAHRDSAGFESTAGLFWPRILRPLVSWATETVIWLGMRL